MSYVLVMIVSARNYPLSCSIILSEQAWKLRKSRFLSNWQVGWSPLFAVEKYCYFITLLVISLHVTLKLQNHRYYSIVFILRRSTIGNSLVDIYYLFINIHSPYINSVKQCKTSLTEHGMRCFRSKH